MNVLSERRSSGSFGRLLRREMSVGLSRQRILVPWRLHRINYRLTRIPRRVTETGRMFVWIL